MSGDQDFDKFREKKLNEKDAAKHDDDAAFFGTFKKKEDEDPDAPKKMKLSDLNIPGKDDRPDNVPKVGETLKLIDIALEPQQKKPVPGHNPPHGARQPQRPAARPGAPGPARPAAQRPAPKPGGGGGGAEPPHATRAQPAQARPQAPRGQRPPAPPPRPTPAPPPKPGMKTPAPRETGALFRPKTGQRPPGATPTAPPKRPPPDLSGFTDHAGTQSHEAPAQPSQDRFEDTTFVEASEHADPYEYKDQGSTSGLDFAEDRSAPNRPQPPQPEKKANASGPFKALRPEDLRAKKFTPAPDPKKASTRRVKRGPLGK